jgi:hypothetical protein
VTALTSSQADLYNTVLNRADWCAFSAKSDAHQSCAGLLLILETGNVVFDFLLRRLQYIQSNFKILLWANHLLKPFETWWTHSIYQKKAITHFFRFFHFLLRGFAIISGTISLNRHFLKNSSINLLEI